ncbi:MAG: hypothetical protein GY784_09945 [Gammaproteobacteria bacterium]|nr:hypothetical protein [Gammaproteobacteria bacterium]
MNLAHWPNLCEMIGACSKDLSITSLSGGSISQAWRVGDNRRCFEVYNETFAIDRGYAASARRMIDTLLAQA